MTFQPRGFHCMRGRSMQERGKQHEISGLFIAQHEKIPQLKSDLTFASCVSYKNCLPCKARRACCKEARGCHLFQKMCLSVQLYKIRPKRPVVAAASIGHVYAI